MKTWTHDHDTLHAREGQKKKTKDNWTDHNPMNAYTSYLGNDNENHDKFKTFTYFSKFSLCTVFFLWVLPLSFLVLQTPCFNLTLLPSFKNNHFFMRSWKQKRNCTQIVNVVGRACAIFMDETENNWINLEKREWILYFIVLRCLYSFVEANTAKWVYWTSCIRQFCLT